MAEATFGERLAEARRIRGETIEEVSDKLRIRPSIILAMEMNDFVHLPHIGYTNNMVSSYARYLRLDPIEITWQFKKEFKHFEATQGRRSEGVSLSLGGRGQPRNRSGATNDSNSDMHGRGNERETISAAGRNEKRGSLWGKEDNQEVDREFRRQLREVQDGQSGREAAGRRRPSSKQTDGENRKSRVVRTNDYKGKPPKQSLLSGVTSGLLSKPILLIIGLVIAFVAILILWAVLANTCSSNDVSNAPVTGAANADEGLNEDQASNNVGDIEAQLAEENRYGPFELVVEVAEGASWIQIDVDGETVIGQTAEAPWSESFIVNENCSIQAGAPAYVRVFRNGIEVELDTTDGLGTLELEVETRQIAQNAQDADTQSQE